MPSDWLIQVVHKTSKEVAHSWVPGLRAETDFVTELVERVGKKKIGLGRTTKTVQDAVREAAEELLFDLKAQV